jgi:hypothetical protein
MCNKIILDLGSIEFLFSEENKKRKFKSNIRRILSKDKFYKHLKNLKYGLA